MTRQNVMPIDADGAPESVLIPLWDMANHSNGHLTTEYVAPYIESRCVRDFKKNEQILISYAQRNNSDFLIHNG